ncbi:MAG: two-component sensor histidine kinase [Betaproteobacteria bacterium HGW-Betaproteobacteria-13]|jgi:two-component system OmpR family sensor kinase|uniref:histidine kinase n=1 Tax=Parazoarcus communis TaxID=41977 RepID=A0A2U8H6Z5_9RHOO|nr:ATP-binding protein [Parazoarcus communis]AWI81737.1 two-component sensor histidine kinase [Parazoarcus communis]PKO56357.1 MAG: two-component sensor histidine kinase [Betaproteobacteria bacterium HGW-Betaproteobacteria-21]PKO80906.1 MAG: two-component sensor histidine kinase [Betaproteobacteria bacterium HGW-Betaproteobacteria-13]
MKGPPSIRSRLSRSVIVIALAWSIAVTVAVWTVIRHEIDELLDNTLQESAQIIFALISYRLEHWPVDGEAPASMPAPKHVERLIWQLADADNKVVLRSHNAPETALLSTRSAGFGDVGDEWRIITMLLPGEHGWILHVAQDAEERREASIEAAQYTAAVALAIGLFCVFWLRRRLKHELRPVAQLSDAVRDFDPLDTRSRLPPVTRAELEPMHHAISALSSRLIQHISNERAFSAHAAHALRTPLAGLDAQLAVALRESPPDLRKRLLRARSAANRLQRVVTALLALFRSGTEPELQDLNMKDLVAHLTFEGLSISVEGVEWIHADADLIAAALMNLLDNAARHHASQVRVTVRKGHGIVLSVSDNGSGIPEAKRVNLQSALSAQTYSGQTGLGLMLADMVARAHGGELKLCDAAPGCTVELHLPQATSVAQPA